MSKLSNELTMIKLLEQRKYSISELSSYLEVSKRMIRIYKNDIEMAGFIIETTYGPNGGYELIKKSNDFLIIKDEYKKLYKFINDCIDSKKNMEIEYITNDIITKRIISPIKIYEYNDNYVVVAFCYLRHDIRQFEFKRIKNIKTL